MADPHRITKFAEVYADTYHNMPAGGAGGSGGDEFEPTSGKTFYVLNATTGLPEGGVTGSNITSAGQLLTPLSTIDYAIGLCVAGRGDRIVVLPGHAETLT